MTKEIRNSHLEHHGELKDCVVIKENIFEEEFLNLCKKKNNIFCNSRINEVLSEKEKFIECKKCFRDFCSECYDICHKCEEKKIKDIDLLTVYEYASTCNCYRNQYKLYPNENCILSFYEDFLNDFYYYFSNKKNNQNSR